VSEITIRRRNRVTAVTIGTATATSSTLWLDDMASATIVLDDPGTAATALRVYGSRDGLTFNELYDGGSAATITLFRQSGTATETVGTATAQITVYTSQPGCYSLPDAAYCLRAVRLVSDVDLGPAANAHVTAKS